MSEEEMTSKRTPMSEDFIEDRETQKKLIHPYRKYQLWIFFMLIIMIILGIMLFNLNTQLNEFITLEKNLFSQISDIDSESKEIKSLYERVELNYKSIYGLDKKLNIDIIHQLHELYTLSGFITSEGSVSYSICYKATVHGESPEVFREKCGGLSPLVYLIETVDGYRFGVYTNVPVNKKSDKGYRSDDEAFIFSFDTMNKYKIVQPEFAMVSIEGGFPTFGKNDIVLGKNILTSSSSFAMFPVSYEKDPEAPGDYILNGGSKKFKVKEMEVLSPSIYQN